MALNGLEKLKALSGFRFADLPETQQNKLTARTLRIVVLDQETSAENRQDLFNRINKFGQKLVSSERRRGAYEGPLMTFLEECSHNKLFRSLCPITLAKEKRKEPLELITRFFAYSERYLEFQHDVDSFIDKFVNDHRNTFDATRYEAEFAGTMQFVHKYFPYGFAKTRNAKTTPRVRFEALAVGINLALREKPDLIPLPVAPWLESEQFEVETTTHASNSAPRLRSRVEFVRDHLLEGAK